MNNFIVVSVSLLTIFMFSCAHTLTGVELQNNDAAIVIVNMYYCFNNCRDHYPLTEHDWYKYIDDKRTDTKYSFANAITAFSIQPGTYFLDDYNIRHSDGLIIKSRQQSETKLEKWVEGLVNKASKTERKFIKFQANQGETVYIGDMEFKISGNDILVITVKDNYEEAAKYFKNKYKNSKKELVKRLAEKLEHVTIN